MAEAQLQIFLEKVRQLNAFVALSEADPQLRRTLRDCADHDQVVALARRYGFEIGRRWGDPPPPPPPGTADLRLGQPPLSTGSLGPQRAVTPASLPLPCTPERTASLLNRPCPPPGQEASEVLLKSPLWRLELIHSCAAASPEGFWYDQGENEWVTLLQGRARLRFDGEEGDRDLSAGDSLLIEAGRRHRVSATDGAPGTIWLALFWCPA